MPDKDVSRPIVSAIVVNYQTAKLLSDCIESLLVQEVPLEIWIIDNSGSEQEHYRIEKLYKTIQLNVIFNRKNVGYGRACNTAIARARGEYLLCMNADVRLEGGALKEMVEGIKETDACLVGPRLYWDRRKRFLLPPSIPENWLIESISFWAARLKLVSRLWSRWWAHQEQRFWKTESPLPQAMISGACLLASRKALRPDGTLFDPSFFLYYEDTELCRRVRQRGKDIYFLPNAHAVHLYAQSPASPSFKETAMARSLKLYRMGYRDWQRRILKIQYRYGSNLFPIKSCHDHYCDLGELDVAPDLSWNEKGSCWFRIGINPVFVPSAGTIAQGGHLKIPSDLWKQMAPGRYFLEVRSSSWRRLGFWSYNKI